MPSECFRIADITLEITANYPWRFRQHRHYSLFETSNNISPDFRFTIQQVGFEDLSQSPVPTDDLKRLSQAAMQWDPACPLLLSTDIRANIIKTLEQSTYIDLTVASHMILLRDFTNKAFIVYYLTDTTWDGSSIYGDPLRLKIIANLRQILASAFPIFGAPLIHSSGLIRKNKAAIFLAPDNGGKSTVMSHSPGDPILNDDQTVWRIQNGVCMAYSTPFGGMTGGPNQAEIGGIFLLKQAPTFELIPARSEDVLQYLWGEHKNIIAFLPRNLKIKTFEVLQEICYRIPTYQMCFPKNNVDWNTIDHIIGV